MLRNGSFLLPLTKLNPHIIAEATKNPINLTTQSVYSPLSKKQIDNRSTLIYTVSVSRNCAICSLQKTL